MNATINDKVAVLNAVYEAVREWQRGAIAHGEMAYRVGGYLTAGQVDSLDARVYRTIDRAALVRAVSDVVGL